MGRAAYIGVGTNLGDRLAIFRKAVEQVGQLPDTRVTRESSLYESEPHGKARNWFLNGVIEVDTDLEATELLKGLQKIETALGRKRDKSKKKSVSREIDLDILLFDTDVIEERRLKVPHPEIAARKFVLLPLSELVPAYKHPVLSQTVSVMLVVCKDDKKVHLFKH